MEEFGIWAMLGFWASAIGGILVAISWARMRRRSSSDKEMMRRNLQKRFERGEIDEKTLEARLRRLDQD